MFARASWIPHGRRALKIIRKRKKEMKQRIIAVILLIVMAVTTLVGCGNYAFLEDDMGDYATVDWEKFIQALGAIEIEEEDFGPDEDREEIVKRDIYNTILTSLNTDENKLTDGKIGAYDMVEYFYYCTWGDYTFDYNMKSSVTSLTTSSSTDEQKDVKEGIVKALAAAGYTLVENDFYKITTSLENERIGEDDTIVVSYKLKTNGDNGTYTLATYANQTIDKNHELFGKLHDLYVGIGSYSDDIEIKESDDEDAKVLRVYSSVTVSHIVENAGTAFTGYEYTTEDETTKTAYKNGKQVTVTIPEGEKIKYNVYPVARVAAPEITAETVIRYALGRNISTDSLDAFGADGVKGLVEALASEYAKTDYTSDDNVKALLDTLNTERANARAEAIEDKIAKLKSAKNSDGKYADDAIVAYYNEANGTTYETITALFKALSDNYTKKIAVNGLLGGIYVDSLAALMSYKYSGSTALSLLNAVNDEIVRDSELAKEDKEYEALSYYDTYTDEVKDAKEKYTEAVEYAEQIAVDAHIAAILAAVDNDTVVSQYKTKVNNEITSTFSPYNLIVNVLLSSSATSSTFSFIDDINDYLYSETKKELSGWDKFWGKEEEGEKVTFSDVLADLVEAFGSTATSDYEDITAVKNALAAHEAAEDALSDKAFEIKAAIVNASYTTAIEKLASALEAATKGEGEDKVTAASAILTYYNGKHSTSYATVEELIDVLSSTTYTKSDKTTLSSRKTITISNLLGSTSALKEYKNESGTTAYSSAETFNSALNSSLTYSAVSAYATLLADCTKTITVTEEGEETTKTVNAFDALAELYISKHSDSVFVMSETGKAENQKVASSNKSTVISAIIDDVDNKTAYENALEGYIFYENTEDSSKNITAKDIFAWLFDITDLTATDTETEEAYTAAQTAAKQAKVDSEVAKLLSCYHKDEDGSVTTVSGELALRYFNNTISTKIDTYNTNVQKKLATEIYEILCKNVTVNGYPEELLEKYTESVRNSYENEFYTGTSDIYSSGTASEGLTQALKDALTAYNKVVADADEAISSADTGMTDAYSAYLSLIVVLGDNGVKLTETEKAYYDAYTAYNAKDDALDDAKEALDDAEDSLAKANEKLEAIKSSDEIGFFDKIGAIFNANKDISAAKKVVKSATKAVETAEDALESAEKSLESAKKALTIDTTDADNTKFVEDKENFESAKSSYTTAKSDYNAAADGASDKESLKKTYLDCASTYLTEAKDYYRSSYKVNEVAESVKTEAENTFIATGKEQWYGDKTFKKAFDKCEDNAEKIDLIKDKYTEAETDTDGEKLSNYLAYGTFEKYLEAKLGYDYDKRIEDEAKAALDTQIILYATAKAFVDNGYTTKYADAIKENEDTFKAIYEYSLKQDDEDLSDKKLEKKVNEYYDELLESADQILVTNEVFKAYKKELGNANYDYYEQSYGEDNLRANLQLSNLFSFLLFTTYEENPYGEGYVIKDYQFVTFTFTEAED